MNFEEFTDVCRHFFQDWLNWLHQNFQNGNMKITGTYSFANIVQIAQSPTHFIVELQGAKKYYPNQKINLEILKKSREVASTTSYFTSGDEITDTTKPTVDFGVEKSSWSGGYIANNFDADLFAKKFGFATPHTGLHIFDAEIPIQIRPEANFIAFNNIDFIRSTGPRIWFRTVVSAFVIQKSVSRKAFINWLLEECNSNLRNRWAVGMTVGVDSSTQQFAKQLLSLSNQNVKEASLDKFIQKHAEHFASVLDYKQLLSQKTLKWIDRQDFDPVESRPDYLMERDDGYFDILDLKTGCTKLQSLTKGGQARIRFTDYVDELIAQLVTYERYFDSQENREWAYRELGIRTKDITLIGVVGNQNNLVRNEVDVVLQRYKNKLFVLSYNDILSIARQRSIATTQNKL